MKKKSFLVLFFLIAVFSVNAQTHISVPLGHPVYLVLDQAQMRGLCSPIPSVKPYSQHRVLLIINEILNNDDARRFGRLTDTEKSILEQFKIDFNTQREGFNFARGTISTEQTAGDVYLSTEFGFGLDLTFAASYYPIAGGFEEQPASGDFFTDALILPNISFMGDLGRNVSYGITLYGFIGKSPRVILGEYQTNINSDPSNPDNFRAIFSEPLAYFPFTYKKRWDGFLFAPGGLSTSGQLAWPREISLGYNMRSEISSSLLNDHVFIRFARVDREWAGMTANGSLILSQSAQPFLAVETVIQPSGWISFSSLTGVLEYDPQWGSSNSARLVVTSQVFQNAFSIVMLETSYKNYLNFTLGSSVVWPKRFELGYLFPLVENFTYQNNIGDFDNLALFLNLQGQYPGIGRLWFSLFLDEANIAEFSRLFEMDRMMYAFQVGGSFNFPWFPFSSVTLSYTKIEPYNYTHIGVNVPWYSVENMETNYVNFGKSLGHYLPPNSDEILFRFETIPMPRLMLSLQYQMIRRGANYGDRAVDGSSLWSELPGDRGWEKLPLRKYFLKDGAYQWIHVFKMRGEYSFIGLKAPVKAFMEIGGVYSYFTDIDSSIEPNSGYPNSYRIINTPVYPHSLNFTGIIGIQIFPKF